MKRTLLVVSFLAIALSIISCSAALAPAPTPVPTAAPAMLAPAMPPVPAVPTVVAEGALKSGSADSTGNVPNAASAERMIVYTVNLRLEVQDTDKAVNDIAAIAAQYKGYIAASNLNRDPNGKMAGTITLRIPADSLDAAQKQIEAAGLKVLSRNKNSNDVTDQYTDLNARLTNLEATRDDLRKMLDSVTEKSNKAEDILAVYNQLSDVQGQIEQIKGQMNVLEKTTTLATLTVELVPHEEVQIVEPETWMPNRTVAQALHALVQALQGIVDLGIWLILFLLPVLIVLLIPFVVLALILRAIFRRRAKKPATT
jgi:multidrug efflux pump subunit AcrA (membrane-fusion protein)